MTLRYLLYLAVALVISVLMFQVFTLRRQLGTKVDVISRSDLDALEFKLERNQDALITRQTEFFVESLRLSRLEGGGRTLERVIERPILVTAGSTGVPRVGGQPLPPKTPLIAPGAAEEARRRAIERVLVRLDPGHLLDCPSPQIPADTIELLRDPSGRLASTNTCVNQISDTTRLPASPGPSTRRGRFKIMGFYSPSKGAGYGLGWEVLRLPILPLSVDAAVKVSPSVAIGPNVGWQVNDRLSAGLAYLWEINRANCQAGCEGIWFSVSFRP